MMSSHFNFDYVLVCIHLLLDFSSAAARALGLATYWLYLLGVLYTLIPNTVARTSPKMSLELHISPLSCIYVVVEQTSNVATMAQRPQRSTVLPGR
jgi:hypothetical protein